MESYVNELEWNLRKVFAKVPVKGSAPDLEKGSDYSLVKESNYYREKDFLVVGEACGRFPVRPVLCPRYVAEVRFSSRF